MGLRKAEILLSYQNVIQEPPVAPKQLYMQAASNDDTTINAWKAIWLKNIKDNHEKYGPFENKSIGQLYESFKLGPCIVAGSGPSLKVNGELLKEKHGIPLISCLHNFHFFEDQGVEVNFYVTLDAGEVTIEEVYEGGTHEEQWYWDRSKDKTLLAYIGSSPRLLEKWQGKILFFNAPIPEKDIMAEIEAIETFNCYVSNGGNVLGACLYIAKGFLGCPTICFVGADFSFSYTHKFHAWDSKYDANLGRIIHAVDVYGNRVPTWQSYLNFKSWFDRISLIEPGIYINATEGGLLGAYREGNIAQIQQMQLKVFLDMFSRHRHLKEQAESPRSAQKLLIF